MGKTIKVVSSGFTGCQSTAIESYETHDSRYELYHHLLESEMYNAEHDYLQSSENKGIRYDHTIYIIIETFYHRQTYCS